jgi:SAM-dependent methyltransferase
MPTIEQNRAEWVSPGSWAQGGDEWSGAWGDAETQWHATLLPRVRKFIPAKNIVEIAPGFGRWSQFLIGQADDYVGVDLTPKCVEACRERFGDSRHARFVVTDGLSLPTVADGSADFIFSFDSLVHVQIEVLAAYLREIARTLSPEGAAFIHHSNLGTFSPARLGLSKALGAAARKVRGSGRLLRPAHLIEWEHWRDPSVTAEQVASIAASLGLACIGQELNNWGEAEEMIDCISVFVRRGSRRDRPNQIVRNPYFMAEAHSAGVVSEIYSSVDR